MAISRDCDFDNLHIVVAELSLYGWKREYDLFRKDNRPGRLF